MNLTSIERVPDISPSKFQKEYLIPQKPLIITELSKQWPAYERWTWDYFKQLVGHVRVGVYNNTRAGARVAVNGADDYMLFGDYLELVQEGPLELRIFLFNIFNYAKGIRADFVFPEQLVNGFLKRYPMLFVGGSGSIAHMHYDIDLSHIFHTQFLGSKRVLLLDNGQSSMIYKMPSTVESAASFVNWHEQLDIEKFPALKYAKAYTAILKHGETLFMPSGYWHHMQYIDSGIAMSLRALPGGIKPKLNAIYHLFGMRGFNNMLIKLLPEWWYHYKREVAQKNANKAMKRLGFI